MDKEKIHYIITYFSNLMTTDEKLALKHQMFTYKTADNQKMRKILTEKGWISSEPEILEFLKNGHQQFEMNIVKRILAETPNEVFFNNCPKCGRLARTPYAKQCRYCSYSWHPRKD